MSHCVVSSPKKISRHYCIPVPAVLGSRMPVAERLGSPLMYAQVIKKNNCWYFQLLKLGDVLILPKLGDVHAVHQAKSMVDIKPRKKWYKCN